MGRRALRARAPAREEIAGGVAGAETRLRSSDRFHAGGDRQDPARHQQGRHRRGDAARGNQPRAHLRVLPDHGRHQPSTARRPGKNGSRAISCRSTPAAIIAAISATSAAWRSAARRMPNSRICSARSRASSAPPSSRSAPACWARRFMPPPSRWCRNPSTTTTWNFLAHGMGMVSHEGAAARRARAGALSERIRATSRWRRAWWSRSRPRFCTARGFIKLEDTVAVTDGGHEIYGEGLRGWNRAGTV